ncbi:MAG TPA: DNA recombination protein RmuC [Candidatus Portnoybacteria bacterium]|nr:DNA recombination protein RmuC [Candidatus Portnoybacteria bacterium]
MNQGLLLVLLGISVAVVGIMAYFLARKKPEEKPQDNSAILMMQEQLKEIRQTLDSKMGESTKLLGDSAKLFQQQHFESGKITRELVEKISKLEDTNKQVVNFADQLQDLQDILKNPKHRGTLGEYYLETVLKNVLPPGSYQTQYEFKNGEKVDAVVFVKEKIIPIDSKFSLENYNRLAEEKNDAEKIRLEKVFVNDLKNRIQETAKYIRPKENTMDFAFMFIPHEAIYYDLLVNKVGALQDEDTNNLIQRAASKYKVIIISPTTLLAYLQVVLQGLKALQIEESAKEIQKYVESLQRHLLTYDDYFKKLGNNLGTTVNMYNRADKEFMKIDKDVVKITGKASEIEPIQIEGPTIGEEE